jgi:2-succinyl-6-hydroxy-2,4-cyclohexadiene-1-carboxylate synthase
MGGRLALHALLEADPPWQAAVIVSAHPGLENPGDRAARMTADAAWAGKALTLGWKDVCNEWNQQDVLDGTIPRDPGTESAMALHRREIARGFVDWSLGAQQPLWERLPEIRIPVLWVVGEKDAKFRALAERAVPLIPRATLAVAPNAGHRVPWSAADWFGSTVVSFLRTASAPI